MGLLASLGRRGAAAALRGGGHLVAVVVPDSVTPWNLRRTASSTSSGLLTLARKELKKRKARKNHQKNQLEKIRMDAERRLGKPLTKNSAASAKRRKTSRMGLLPVGFRLSSIWPTSKAPAPAGTAAKRPGPRPSTTKGVVNLSRKAARAQVVAIIHQPVPNEPKFNKNAWARGAGLRSSTDWDSPIPSTRNPLPTSRGRRKQHIKRQRRLRF